LPLPGPTRGHIPPPWFYKNAWWVVNALVAHARVPSIQTHFTTTSWWAWKATGLLIKPCGNPHPNPHAVVSTRVVVDTRTGGKFTRGVKSTHWWVANAWREEYALAPTPRVVHSY